MIDAHCHLLFGVDDASTNIETSLDMLRLANSDGIDTICCTSHVKEGMFENNKDSLYPSFLALKELVNKYKLGINLVFSAENYLSYYTIHKLKDHSFIPYEKTNYLLIEFSWTINQHDNPCELLNKVINAGYQVIIAHPERYEWVHKDYSLIKKWHDMGCLMQLNRTSILGLDKISKANEFAKKILDDGYCDIVGSDAHRAYAPRLPKLSDCYRYVCENYGKSKADDMFNNTMERILKNKRSG